MIRRFLEGLDNPQRPLNGPSYKLLCLIGLILPNSRKRKAAYIFLHGLGVFCVITEYMELYILRSDREEVIIILNYAMISMFCVVKVYTFIMWQDKWLHILNYVTDADLFERDNADEEKSKIIDKYTKYCRRVTYFWWFLSFTTCCSAILSPLMRYLSSSVYREELRNGTELFPHIFSAWVPFDKYHSPGCWITVLWHVFIAVYWAIILAAYDSNVIVVMVFFGGQLKLLRERCKLMLGSVGKGISDQEADRLIRQIHSIHTLLTKNSRLFNSILSPVMFLYVLVCSLMLCISAYQLTSTTNPMQKLLLAEYLIYIIAQLFVFSWHSNEVFAESENVSLGPYESEWWSASVRQRRSVLILLGQLRISYLFTAGPFTNLNLSTFVTILKGACSYYSLLRNNIREDSK